MVVVVVSVVARHGEGGDAQTLGSDHPGARVRGLPSLRQSLSPRRSSIEEFYNPLRRHSALGYLTPNEYEALHSKETQAALS